MSSDADVAEQDRYDTRTAVTSNGADEDGSKLGNHLNADIPRSSDDRIIGLAVAEWSHLDPDEFLSEVDLDEWRKRHDQG